MLKWLGAEVSVCVCVCVCVCDSHNITHYVPKQQKMVGILTEWGMFTL